MKKNILITGGAGFIGYNLYRKINKNKNKIYILDFKNKIKKKNFYKDCEFIYGDISKRNIFDKIKKEKIIFDKIFHFAAETSTFLCQKFPKKCFDTNVIGTINLFDYCKINKPKSLIFTSSMAVYGKNALNVKENFKTRPISNYGRSKLKGEKILNKLIKENINVKIFRIFNAYGPYQDYDNKFQGMLSIYLSQIKRNSFVKVTGSLDRARDFIYIKDIIDVFLKKNIIENKKFNTFNIASGKKILVASLISKLFKMFKKKKIIKIEKKHSGDSDIMYANIDLLKKFGFKNKFSLEKGIKLMINDIKKFDENSSHINR